MSAQRAKQLTEQRRLELFRDILRTAVVGVSAVPSPVIDRINIRRATHIAMRRSLSALPVAVDYALIDGNDLPQHLPCCGETLVKGDARSVSIAAASIVAKVVRDEMMVAAAQSVPRYGFEHHKGYGTPEHLEAIRRLGPSPLHRLTFSPFVQYEMAF